MAKCARCGHEIREEEARFCSNCGALTDSAKVGPSPFAKALDKETKPAKKHALIMEALRDNPDDFEANEALLFLGRLHEPRRGGALDFSIIKCHLLCIYDEPEKLSGDAREAKRRELFEDEQLQRTMALAPSRDAFFKGYLERMAREYIDLFIRGDNRYASWGFGFPRAADSLAKSCAEPVCRMVAHVEADAALDEVVREQLRQALIEGYEGAFPGYRL